MREGEVFGRGLSVGISVLWLSLLVLIPLATLPLRALELTPERFVQLVTAPRTVAAFRLSLTAAAVAAAINLVFGSLVAWVLERYRFPLRRVVDGVVDLPFALPTAVAGISLATLYAKDGWIGRLLAPAGIEVAFSPAGIVVALVFVGLPFVVRTVQPILRDLDPAVEEASATLGAGRALTFRRVVLPRFLPAAATGAVVAFARGLGEYGSVIFIAGNMPMRSEITPLLIMIQLEQFDYPAATAVALTFLVVSFALLLVANRLTRMVGARAGSGA